MAAPPELTLKDLTGDWIMNKTLSDDTDAMLAVQGIGWITRRAISWATITLHTKQYRDEQGATHIDIEQTATGGLKGTTEARTLDWAEREHSDYLFGDLVGRTRWIAAGDANWGVLDSFLVEGWLEGGGESAGPGGETHVQSFVNNAERGWTAEQIWGFAVLGDGKRYHTRRIICRKGEDVNCVRLVYDWSPKPAAKK